MYVKPSQSHWCGGSSRSHNLQTTYLDSRVWPPPLRYFHSSVSARFFLNGNGHLEKAERAFTIASTLPSGAFVAFFEQGFRFKLNEQ